MSELSRRVCPREEERAPSGNQSEMPGRSTDDVRGRHALRIRGATPASALPATPERARLPRARGATRPPALVLPRRLRGRDPPRARVRPRRRAPRSSRLRRRRRRRRPRLGLVRRRPRSSSWAQRSSSTRPTCAAPARRSPRRALSRSPPLATSSSAKRSGTHGFSSFRRSSRSRSSSAFCSGFDVLADVSLWTQSPNGIECIVSARHRRAVRAGASAPRRRRPFAGARVSRSSADRSCASIPVLRFGEAYAAIVGRLGSVEQDVADAYLTEAAAALSPVIERERLLEHSAAPRADARSRRPSAASCASASTCTTARSRTCSRSPADVQLLQQQVYPFILEDYREQAHGRFDDLSARLVELDRQLREIAHSLETKSVISPPARGDPPSRGRRLRGALRDSAPSSRSAATRTRSRRLSGSRSSGRSRRRSRTSASTRARRTCPCASARGGARSSSRSSTTGWASRSSVRSPRQRSAAGSASSASASAFAW